MHTTIPLLRATACPRPPRRGLATRPVNPNDPGNPPCVPGQVNASPRRTGGLTP